MVGLILPGSERCYFPLRIERGASLLLVCFFFSSRRRHTRFDCDWSSDVCSSDLVAPRPRLAVTLGDPRGIGPEVVAKALSLGPLPADVVVLGSGERGAEPSAAPPRPAPRSLLPEGAGRIAGEAVEEAVRLALRGEGGLERPRRAVCALTPHAGEGGLLGAGADRVLRRAAARLGAGGPIPADTVFVRALKGEFDAVLAPYHDVGMTAVKVAGFGKGVNVTLGLPFPRTAPDHGTALDIAGKGVADPSSMRAALELAVQLAARNRLPEPV